MKRKNAEMIGTLISRFLRQEGLETPLNEHRAVTIWPDIVGSAIAKATADVQLRNSTLYVKITKPALRQELTMHRTQLVRLVNERVGAQVINQIHFF